MSQDYRPLETEDGRVWSTLPVAALAAYVEHQVAHLFPDGFKAPAGTWSAAVSRALAALSRCFSRIAIAGYTREGEAALSHLHGDRYAVFLALLAREFHREGDAGLASRTYLLNKALHGLDLFYEVELPEVFLLVHPVGTVIGRAKLGNFLCVRLPELHHRGYPAERNAGIPASRGGHDTVCEKHLDRPLRSWRPGSHGGRFDACQCFGAGRLAGHGG